MSLFDRRSPLAAVAARQVKAWVAEILWLDDETVVTVAQLACREEGCPPVETSIGVLLPGRSQRASIHKPVHEVTRADVEQALQGLDCAHRHS